MRLRRRPPPPPPLPNPAALPVAELVACLRAAGLALVAAALGGRAAGDWLPAGGPALLAAFRDAPRPLPNESFAQLSGDVAHGRRSAEAWRPGAIVAARAATGLNEGHALPPGGWEALGRWAWGGPAFQRDAAELMEGTLRASVLFMLGDFSTLRQPVISVSPQTVWLLLALAAPGRAPRLPWPRRLAAVARAMWADARAGRRLWPRPPDEATLTRRMLVELGRGHGLLPGWAGVWDQWLLLLAARRWPGERDDPIHAAIAALPLAPVRAPRLGPAPVPLAHPDWQNDTPAWFQVWWTRPAGGRPPASKEQP